MRVWTFLLSCLAVTRGENVAMTSSGTAVFTSEGRLFVATRDGEPVQAPGEVDNFSDVAVDPANEALVFALSTDDQFVCQFEIDEAAGRLRRGTCVGDGFSVSPFSGIAANGGTLVISGGTGGLTVYTYDTTIDPEPAVLNLEESNVIGHPDVTLVSPTLAALSTDFSGGGARFGTQMATISGGSVSFGADYRVEDSLGFDLALGPANFPLVNAAFQGRYLYTANGAMQVQDLETGEVRVLDPRSELAEATCGGNQACENSFKEEFQAVTVAVNEARQAVVFGGLQESGGTRVIFFGLEKDPMSPTRFAVLENNPLARITSIASGGDVIAYVLATADPPTGAVDITFVDLPDPLPADHTNDDVAADDENVTGFPPVDDLTDGARGLRAAFAATACAIALAV